MKAIFYYGFQQCIDTVYKEKVENLQYLVDSYTDTVKFERDLIEEQNKKIEKLQKEIDELKGQK